MSQPPFNALPILLGLFGSPGWSLAEAARSPRTAALALLVLAVSVLAGSLVYFGRMDEGWLIEQQLASVDLPASRVQEAREALARFAPYTGLFAAINSLLSLFFIGVAVTGLAMLMERLSGTGQTPLRVWSSLMAWCMLPVGLHWLCLALLSISADTPNLGAAPTRHFRIEDFIGASSSDGWLLFCLAKLSVFYLWSALLAGVAYWTQTREVIRISPVLGSSLAGLVTLSMAAAMTWSAA